MPRPATIGDAGFISRVVIAAGQDAYRDFLPLSAANLLQFSPCWWTLFASMDLGQRGRQI
jgi:hypothetical protein